MLRIERHREERREVEPEADPTFLEGTDEVRFEAVNREEIYGWIWPNALRAGVLEAEQGDQRPAAALLQKITGLSRSQVKRLISAYVATGTVKERSYRRYRFAQRYTSVDVALLAEVDEAHETLSGPATRKILEREFEPYSDRRMNAGLGSRRRIFTICAGAGPIWKSVYGTRRRVRCR